MSEPIFHYFDDCLPEAHPRNILALHCCDCTVMVMCMNEVMRPWFESGIGEICIICFVKRYESAGKPLWSFEELEVSDGV